MSSTPLKGRRVLALGPGLLEMAGKPLKGAAVEAAGLEALADVRAAARDLVLIDADAWEAPALAAAIQTLTGVDDAPPIMLIGERLPTAVVRNLLRLQRSDVLEKPFTPEQFAVAVAALLASAEVGSAAPEPAAGPASASRCWAVTGAVGGAGATTLAVEIATALAARTTKERSVCLVDLNLADGAACAYLGAQPAMHLGDFAAEPERIDAAVLQALATPASKSLDLLAGPRDPEAFASVSREVILRLLEVACECYDWVILDVPRHRRPWTLEALAGSDEVIVVSELTVPALLAARSLAQEIEESLGPPRKARVVLNRLANRMFGPAPSMAEAERALLRKADGGISSDWEAAAASANLGGPIAQHRPKSKIVKDVAALVDKIADPSASGAAPAPKRAA